MSIYSAKKYFSDRLKEGESIKSGRENAIVLNDFENNIDYNNEIEFNVNRYFSGDYEYKGAGKRRLSLNSSFFDGVVWWVYLKRDDGKHILYYESNYYDLTNISDIIIVYSPYERSEQAAGENITPPMQTLPPYYMKRGFDFSDGRKLIATKQKSATGIAVNEDCLIMEGKGRLSYAFLTFFKDKKAEGREARDTYTVSPPKGADIRLAAGNANLAGNLVAPDGFVGTEKKSVGDAASPLKFVYQVENDGWRVYYSIGSTVINDGDIYTLNNKFKGKSMVENFIINAVYL